MGKLQMMISYDDLKDALDLRPEIMIVDAGSDFVDRIAERIVVIIDDPEWTREPHPLCQPTAVNWQTMTNEGEK